MRPWIVMTLLSVAATQAQPLQTVHYRVRFPAPATHYAEVEAQFPGGGTELFLPVWTPGSYLVREYSRNFEDVRGVAEDGKPLALIKSRKNRWRVSGSGGRPFTIRYRVYCNELTVRTNFVDDSFALLNGAATYLAEVGTPPRHYEVQLDLPPGWQRSISGLDEIAPNRFEAPDYDTLVDSPILAGSPAVHEFEVAGKKHYLVNQGETALWDGARAAADTRKIVEANLRLWGSLPYSKYVFLNLIGDGGGGVEHRNSVTMMSGRYATRTHRSYRGWLGLVSHEFFHAWNVKRLRPVELGPFDYENEVYTTNLWIAEGFTEYYGGLMLRRAGLATEDEILGIGTEANAGGLAASIRDLQTTPGRLSQAVSLASFDAWIKLYRPDENSRNSTIDYYTKGGVIAWLLDAKLRRATKDTKSLDDLMRLAYSRYGGETGYTTAQWVATASEVAGEDLAPWFHSVTETTNELDYKEALDWFGLDFKKPEPAKADNRPKAWTGLETRGANGRLTISQISRQSPGEKAGLQVGDEILAIDGWRLLPEGWPSRLEQYAPGDRITFTVSRRDKLREFPLTLAEEPPRAWTLERRTDASAEQKRHLAAWLATR